MSIATDLLDGLDSWFRSPLKRLKKAVGLYRRPHDYFTGGLKKWEKKDLLVFLHPKDYKRLRGAWAKWIPTLSRCGFRLNFTSSLTDEERADITMRIDDPKARVLKGKSWTHTDTDGEVITKAKLLISDKEEGRGFMGVCLHEIGHAFGLLHSPNDDDCMADPVQVDYVSSTDCGTMEMNYERH